MADLKMTLACWNYDRTRALMDGSVKPEGIDLTYHNSFPAATFHRMMGKREFEASELGLTFYLDSLHEEDPPFVAIPVYPIRLFSHSAIYINTNKGIEQPKDLIGILPLRPRRWHLVEGHPAGSLRRAGRQLFQLHRRSRTADAAVALVQAEAAAAH